MQWVGPGVGASTAASGQTAGRELFGEGTAKARQWSRTWCELLRLEGGRVVWDRLRRTRHRYQADAARLAALQQLLNYLDRHAEHLDYPRFIGNDWPISSGPMESTCKQLGLRLKGPGMRWNRRNVTPMARLLCRWITDKPLPYAA